MGIFKKMKEKKEKEKKAKQEAVDRYLEEVVFPSLLFKRILKNAEQEGSRVIVNDICFRWSGHAWVTVEKIDID